MNKKKTTLKGFTLIELIIVLAIFSVIMTLVMSFIDPVSKIMTKTSVRERTAAYVDNINEYVSKSIRHAQNIWVYEHGLNGDEENLVVDFVNTYYDGAGYKEEGKDFESLDLKVHVLKLINTDEGSLKAGRIYESVYSITAGKSMPGYYRYLDKTTYQEVDNSVIEAFKSSHTTEEFDDFVAQNYIKCEGKQYDASKNCPPAQIKDKNLNVSVINDEHFKEYSYYYQLGMYTFDPIKDSLEDYSGLTEDTNYFYSRLNKVTKSGLEISDGVDGYELVMNVVSFKNDTDEDGNLLGKVNSVHTIGDGATATTEDLTAFRSPAAMNSTGITFKNIQLQKSTGKAISYYRQKLKEVTALDGSKTYEPEKDEDNNEIIEPVRNNDTPDPFRRITDGTSDNIYMIFAVPSETDDTKWQSPVAVPQPTTNSEGKLPPV